MNDKEKTLDEVLQYGDKKKVSNILSAIIERLNEFRQKTLISDAIDCIPEINGANQAINAIAKFSNDYKLGYAWKCFADGINEEQSLNLLWEYVSDSDRAFFISNEFRKIILSNSLLSSSLIAYIIGQIVKEKRKCTHEEVILLDAIAEMTDYDIRNFKTMMESANDSIAGRDVIEITKLGEENRNSYNYTLKRCANSGIFEVESNFIGDSLDEDDEEDFYACSIYVVTNMSRTLMSYLERIKPLLRYDI